MAQGDGSVTGSDPARILGKRAIPDVKQAVLYLPVSTGQFEQRSGVTDLWRQGRDGIDDLLLAAIFEFAAVFDPHDLPGARPIVVEPRRDRTHSNPSGLNAAMRLFHSLGTTHIPGVDALSPLTRIGRYP
jgi:hypothetical protein